MTQIDDLLARVLSTLATVYTKQAFDGVAGQIRKAFPSANQSGAINTGALHEMEEIIKKNPPTSLDIQSNIDTLSRWFEIPRDEFSYVTADKLETDTMVRHVYLEQVFTSWLTELRYQISTGDKMIGLGACPIRPFSGGLVKE